MAKQKDVALVLTAAIVLDGEIVPAKSEVTVPYKLAKNLLYRGKAVLGDQPEDEGEEAKLSDLTVAQLKEYADQLGVDGYASMNKADLIAAIELAEEDAGE